jgi:hypothetical protein
MLNCFRRARVLSVDVFGDRIGHRNVWDTTKRVSPGCDWRVPLRRRPNFRNGASYPE